MTTYCSEYMLWQEPYESWDYDLATHLEAIEERNDWFDQNSDQPQ